MSAFRDYVDRYFEHREGLIRGVLLNTSTNPSKTNELICKRIAINSTYDVCDIKSNPEGLNDFEEALGINHKLFKCPWEVKNDN